MGAIQLSIKKIEEIYKDVESIEQLINIVQLCLRIAELQDK